jgi:hypothetical protein
MGFKDSYEIKSIAYQQAMAVVVEKHYLHRKCPVSHAFGLFERAGDELVGVVTYGVSPSSTLLKGICGPEEAKNVYELNRLVINDNLEKNIASFFISSSIKYLPKMIIVSYADSHQNHHGYVYQATNWIYTGKTKERTDIGFDDNSHSRHYQKGIDTKLNRKFRSSKHRYCIFIGSKQDKKQFIKSLKYQIHPYPKGNNQRYDSSYQPLIQTSLF